MKFLNQLRNRNPLLYWFGWLNLLGVLICLVLTQVSTIQVLGINAFIKPLKFFLSIFVFSWTMGWLLHELQRPKAAKAYSVMVVIVLAFELIVITWQAANGRMSHFNVSTPLYGILFSLMGIAITILGLWTIVIAVYFFRKKIFDAPMPYIWGIRLGLIFFVIFSFEGGLMASQLSHTVGEADGSPGVPVFNWSRQYGDLRIAHFFGMHALQLLPLFGYFIAKSKMQVIVVGIVYFLMVTFVFIQALQGIPLIRY